MSTHIPPVIPTASPKQPSAWQLERSVALYQQLQQVMVADDPSFIPDEDEIASLIQDAGLTPPHILLSRLIDAAVLVEQREEQADNLRKRYAARRDRYAARGERLRATITDLLAVLNTGAYEGELGAAAIRKTPAKVIVTDISKLPEALIRRPPPEADKITIGKLLKAGETVEGAEMSNPGTTLRITAY